MTTVILATRNAHKVEEIRAILDAQVRTFSLKDFPGAPATVEDAPTFAGNASKKAHELAEWLATEGDGPVVSNLWPCWVLADDSGLEVDALGGLPGVHSARYATLDDHALPIPAASPNTPDAANNAKLLQRLEAVPIAERTARFRCVLALVEVTSGKVVREPQFFEGVCAGRIALSPSGRGGFGYDPLFVPDGYQSSFAELGDDVKNTLSHRAKALAVLRKNWG